MSAKIFFVSIGLSLASGISADQLLPDKTVAQALAGINSLDYQASTDYAFTKLISGEKGNRLIQFDPDRAKADQWQLIQLDQRQPTAVQQQQYRQEVLEYREQQAESMAASKVNPLLNSIDLDSLKLLAEDQRQRQYQFKISDEKHRPYIEGILTVNFDCQCVVSIVASNPKPFSPQLMVKVSEYRESYIFTPQSAGGSVISRIDKRIKGRAFFTDLSQNYSEVYTGVVLVRKSGDGMKVVGGQDVAASFERI